jgi:Ca2+-binding EF-hand superfamily protein
MASVPTIANLIKKRASTQKERELMKELFRMADSNRDGSVDFVEYRRIFAKKGLYLSTEEVKDIFNLADKNGDR